MNTSTALDWFRQLLWVAVLTAGPVVLVAAIIGLVIGVVQAVTQVNDASVSFGPKALAVVLVLVMAGPWMMQQMSSFAVSALTAIATVHR